MLFGRPDDKVETGRLHVLEIGKDNCLDLINGSRDRFLLGFVVQIQAGKIELDGSPGNPEDYWQRSRLFWSDGLESP